MYRKWLKNIRQNDAKANSDQDFVRQILCGDVEVCEAAGKKALRLFVSSTFTDTKPERNYLMREIYPQIRAYCEQRGIQFSTVDLRWGIRDSSTNDHMTAEICMSEIIKCREVSIDGPSFLLLSFNKYGAPSLPRIIQAVEFDILLHQLEVEKIEDEVMELLLKWYKCDDNSVPAVRILQPISSQLPEYNTAKDIDEQKRIRGIWWNIEEKMLQALISAAQNCRELSPEQKLRWKLSTTHQEVKLGVMSAGSKFSNCLCYMRDIKDFQDLRFTSDITVGKKILGRNIDLTRDRLQVDGETTVLRNKMREEVEMKGVLCKRYTVDWAEEGILETTHGEYMKELGDNIKMDLLGGIKRALDRVPKLNLCLQEASSHMTFCSKRAKSFQGREYLISAGLQYFEKNDGRANALVVHGISGSGKTSLMAKLAICCRNIVRNTSKNPLLLVRFCGTSPGTSSAMALMKNLTEHIEWFYSQKQPKANTSENFHTVTKQFHDSLDQATGDQPLIIFIDSLDQLSDDNQGRSQLSWLPSQLPPHTFLVVSTLPDVGGCLKYLKAHTDIPAENYLEVKPLSPDDASNIMKEWLGDFKRTLRNDQFEHLLAAALDSNVEPPTMLRLKLLLDMARTWRSYDELPECHTSVRRQINNLFEDLEKTHGDIFVSHLFGLIALSRQGLSEAELMDILSGDEKVLDSVLQYHKPPVRRLPQIVFARLRNALGDYLVERGTNQGKLVLSWYHRQFWEAAEWKYLYDKKDVKYFGDLIAKYYSMQMHKSYPERAFNEQPLYYETKSENELTGVNKHLFNESKIWELPSALLKANRYKDFGEIVCNLTFIAATVETGVARDLIAILREAVKLQSRDVRVIPPFKMKVSKEDILLQKKLDSYSIFLATNMHIFTKKPELVLQQAINMPDESLVHRDALPLTSPDVYPWLHKHLALTTLINKPQGKTPCLFTMSAHDEAITDIVRPIMSPRNMELALTSCKGGLIVCYNLVTGSVVMSLQTGCGITRLALLNQDPAGAQFDVLASCLDGTVKSWTISFETGQASSVPKLLWRAHDEYNKDVTLDYITMALSPTTQYLATGTSELREGSLGGKLKLWDLDQVDRSGKPSCLIDVSDLNDVVPGHKTGVFGVAFLGFLTGNDFIVVALGRNKLVRTPQENLISICSSDSLTPLCVIKDAMFQPKWINMRVFKWWKTSTAGENVFSLLVSTDCSQMRYVVSTCPRGDVKVKCLWVHQTDHGFHSSIVHTLERVVVSGLGCNVQLWGMPDLVQAPRDQWDTWSTEANNLSLDKLDTFRGHGHSVKVVHVSDHDDLVCTGATNGVLKVWKMSQMREYKYPSMHKDGIFACTVSSDGSMLVTGCASGRLTAAELYVWNPMTGELCSVLKNNLGHKITAAAFSPDSKLLCYRSEKENCVCIVKMEKQRISSDSQEDSYTVNLGGDASDQTIWGKDHLDWSSDGKCILATSTDTKNIWIIDVEEKKANAMKVHQGIVLGGCFASKDKYFATWCSAFSSDLNADVPDAKSEIKLFDNATKKLLSTYCAADEYTKIASDKNNEPLAGITTCKFVPFTESLAAATSSGHILICAIPSLTINQVINAHSHTLTTLSIVTHKQKAYIVTAYSKIRVWDASTFDEVAVYHNGALVTCATGISNSADGKIYIQAGDTIGKLIVLKVDI